jgi:hypothetical protein
MQKILVNTHEDLVMVAYNAYRLFVLGSLTLLFLWLAAASRIGGGTGTGFFYSNIFCAHQAIIEG